MPPQDWARSCTCGIGIQQVDNPTSCVRTCPRRVEAKEHRCPLGTSSAKSSEIYASWQIFCQDLRNLRLWQIFCKNLPNWKSPAGPAATWASTSAVAAKGQCVQTFSQRPPAAPAVIVSQRPSRTRLQKRLTASGASIGQLQAKQIRLLQGSDMQGSLSIAISTDVRSFTERCLLFFPLGRPRCAACERAAH